MIGQIKVLVVGGRNFPITDKLFEMLSADVEIEGEISRIIGEAIGKKKVWKKGKK
jgi:hypothetical protein